MPALAGAAVLQKRLELSLLHLDHVSGLPSGQDFLIVTSRVFLIKPLSSAPAHPPSPGEQLFHLLHRDPFGLRRPKPQNDKARRTHHRPEDVRAVDVQADEHVGRDADNRELEEPVQRHVGGVAHAADPRWVDFGAVQVLHGAEADRPPSGVDEDGRNRRVRRALVVAALPHRHVHGHVDVSDALQEQPRQHTSTPPDLVHQAPCEHHREHEFDDSVCAGRDQRGVGAFDARVFEDLGVEKCQQ